MTNANHTMNSQEHYTPIHIIEMARTVLGGIDLDPFSCAIANKIVGAKRYFIKDTDAFDMNWNPGGQPISIWCNPPGSRFIKPSTPMRAWKAVVDLSKQSKISHCLFLAYSPDMVRQSRASTGISMLSFPICLPDERIAFLDKKLTPRSSPPHGNMIVYVPGTIDNTKGFEDVFRYLGEVKI